MRQLLAIAVTVVAAGCSTGTQETTSTAVPATATTAAPNTDATPTTTSALPNTTVTAPETIVLPDPIADWHIGHYELDGAELLVAIASTPEQRRQGLMNITDLLDLDGMLFVFAADTGTGFWMKNTLIPLDIAFFDWQGKYVDGFVMEPCTIEECPTYFPSGRYRFALEMPAGTMPENPKSLIASAREF